ncbi:hypothetical protein GE061_020185 [Apolygus lucorum]|uniref:Uncharacterized protein n=1 Tax=Apolygus lucorum TaxID=248454 RepID=A0A8S9WIC7_APOLU|nr:hypothetical protein GE061_020185 [Apolygus lucorum]
MRTPAFLNIVYEAGGSDQSAKWANFGKQNWRCGMNQTRTGRWPWKSESAKECVTTHLPKQLALKMDGAVASCLYSAVNGNAGGHSHG